MVSSDKLFISIIAGKTIAWYEEHLIKDIKLVRAMQNIPALVGEGMTGACANDKVNKEELDKAITILSAFGKVEVVPNGLMDVVVA